MRKAENVAQLKRFRLKLKVNKQSRYQHMLNEVVETNQ
jgi:hypothetical protein